jgi:hypothetical protein
MFALGNFSTVPDDLTAVTRIDRADCAVWQQAISAMVDGESFEVDERLLTAHLARCTSCDTFRQVAEQSRRQSRVRPAEPTRDLSREVVHSARVADRARSWQVIRCALAAVAIVILVLAVPDLLGSGEGGSTHETRHLGAFTVAYGVGLLVVVVRPARARTMVPVAAVLGGALLITAVIDLVAGRIPLGGEATHLPEVLSVVLLWLLAVPVGRRATREQHRGARRDSSAMLRLVEPASSDEQRLTG